jgi:S-(hydroxymethyl)glutathione dehydrogenase / alcohol dehydrogenase
MINVNKIKQCYAAILHKIGEPLEICKLEVPIIVEGQVLVKILFSGVCRSQVMEIQGGRGGDPWLPHLLGHEGSGIVVEVGEGVTKVQPGDEVILGWIKGDGIDAAGAKYKSGDKVINSGRVTTFSNYSVVSENRLVKKPKGLPFDEAVLFGCALPTGAGMALNEINPSAGESVVVLGLGGIGLSALMALKALGVNNIIAADISEEKLEMARKLGVSHCLNTKDKDFQGLIKKITAGGADFCIESAGSVATIELGFSLIKTNGGKLLFASHPPEGREIKLTPHELISGKQIAGSWGGATQPDRDIPIMFDKFKTAKIPLETLLTKRYKLEEINEALDDLDVGRVFRPLIVMEHEG